jgi:TfoX/Sxy family transcriptional regulator of competence genes
MDISAAGATMPNVARMAPGSMPKPSENAKAAFTRLVPGDPRVTLRPMFGNLAAFVNGNMFAGLFGEGLFVRLPDAESAPVRKAGGRDFEPMAGHAMRGYVMVPGTWQSRPEPARGWIKQALAITAKLPAKAAAAKKTTASKKKSR